MPSYVPPTRATELIFYIALPSQADANLFQVDPTLAAGDFTVYTDGVSGGTLDTTPSVVPAGSPAVKITLSIAEMTGDNINLWCHDAAGAQWCDVFININTVTRQIDALAFPNTAGRGIDVTATGGVGIDWGNVENPTTTLNLSGTAVGTATALGTQAKADVNAEVVDAINTDTYAEPSTVPAFPLSLVSMQRFLTGALINGLVVDSNTGALTFRNAAAAALWKKVITNAAGVYTEVKASTP